MCSECLTQAVGGVASSLRRWLRSSGFGALILARLGVLWLVLFSVRPGFISLCFRLVRVRRGRSSSRALDIGQRKGGHHGLLLRRLAVRRRRNWCHRSRSSTSGSGSGLARLGRAVGGSHGGQKGERAAEKRP